MLFRSAMVQMPDHGELKREAFTNFDHVFTGHFHKRQTYKNITYIGNCFPHNYADAGDDERGLTVLEWGKDPEYHAWPDQPKYRVFQLSDVIHHTAQRHQRPNVNQVIGRQPHGSAATEPHLAPWWRAPRQLQPPGTRAPVTHHVPARRTLHR